MRSIIAGSIIALIASTTYAIPSNMKEEYLGKKSKARVEARFKDQSLKRRIRSKKPLRLEDRQNIAEELKENAKRNDCKTFKIKDVTSDNMLNKISSLIEEDKCE